MQKVLHAACLHAPLPRHANEIKEILLVLIADYQER